MEKDCNFIKIAVFVALQDAGEATRSLEIAKGIRELCPLDTNLEIIFLSHGGKFEDKVIDSGFKIYKCEYQFAGIGFREDLRPTSNNFVGSEEIAFKLIDSEIKALKELRPNFIIHGFWPFASIARRMISKPVPGICFLPIPFEKNAFASFLMKDTPDQIKPLTYLPVKLRRTIMKLIPKTLKVNAPIMRQTNIINALKKYPHCNIKPKNLFDLLESDLTIVNDMNKFYIGEHIPENFKIVGPLYSPSRVDAEIDPLIKKVLLEDKSEFKIFCTMGSSGTKEQLLEAIKAIISITSFKCNALILAPKSVCQLDEALKCAENTKGIYITDKFIPAAFINSMVDIVVCHGGQGTVQTAVASGTPIVGVAMQPEQQINLDNIMINGAGIRIPINRWKASNIQKAIKIIQNDQSYRKNAKKLQKYMKGIDGKRNSAEVIWKFLQSKGKNI